MANGKAPRDRGSLFQNLGPPTEKVLLLRAVFKRYGKIKETEDLLVIGFGGKHIAMVTM